MGDNDSHKVSFLSDEGSSVSSEGSKKERNGTSKKDSYTSKQNRSKQLRPNDYVRIRRYSKVENPKKLTDFYTSIVEDIECDDEEKRRSAIAASYNIAKPKSKKDEEERKRS